MTCVEKPDLQLMVRGIEPLIVEFK